MPICELASRCAITITQPCFYNLFPLALQVATKANNILLVTHFRIRTRLRPPLSDHETSLPQYNDFPSDLRMSFLIFPLQARFCHVSCWVISFNMSSFFSPLIFRLITTLRRYRRFKSYYLYFYLFIFAYTCVYVCALTSSRTTVVRMCTFVCVWIWISFIE